MNFKIAIIIIIFYICLFIQQMKSQSKGSRRLIDMSNQNQKLNTEEDRQTLFRQGTETRRYNYEQDNQTNKKKLIALVLVGVIIVLSLYVNKDFINQQLVIQKITINQHLLQALNKLDYEYPSRYLQIQKITKHPQLPFCILIQNSDSSIYQQIKQSIQSQNYQNKTIIHINGKNNQKLTNNISSTSYYVYLRQIKEKCPYQSVLLFADVPLKQNSLIKINNLHQSYNTWLIYNITLNNNKTFPNKNEQIVSTKQIKHLQVISVYKRVFQLIGTNDFWRMNKKILQKQFNSNFIMTALFQLCKFYSLQTNLQQIYNEDINGNNFMSCNTSTNSQNTLYRRVPYQPLHGLNQDYKILNIDNLNKKRYNFKHSNRTLTQQYLLWARQSIMNHADIQRALQYQQILYLPQTHSLNLLEIQRMQQLYQSGKYNDIELPLCINVNSHNNMQNDRYKKVLDSITAQNYTNYHIVFIDDFSSDATLNQTKQYLENVLKFEKSRVTYVRNNQQKRATFNIINAAFNYCRKDSIQLLVDGDDQLIGKQVFKMINAQYQAHNLWVMYTFYKSDKYDEGVSLPFKPQLLRNSKGGRALQYFFGHLITFKVSLLRKVPLSQHLNEVGNFLDTMYDTALQYPLFQMAGLDHSKYVNQVSYLYFTGYGDNDDSSIFKIIRRDLLHLFISLRSPLAKLQVLDDQIQDKDVRQILQKQKGHKFIQIK